MRNTFFGCGSEELTRRETLVCIAEAVACAGLIIGFVPALHFAFELFGVIYLNYGLPAL